MATRMNRVQRARMACGVAAAAAMLGGVLAGAVPASAATIAVTTTNDGGAGSLRDAISVANLNPGPDMITVPPGTYTLTMAGANEDGNATGDLDIKGDLTIVGTGGASVTTVDAAGLDRGFDVLSGTVTLQGLTITGGNSGVGTTNGGGVRHGGSGSLTVADSVVSGNHAWSGAGIVSWASTLTITRSEIVGNIATSEPGNGSVGGGVEKANYGGALVVSDSLIADNQSVGGNAGALYSTGTTSIVNTTITGNSQYTRAVLFEQGSGHSSTADLRFVTIAGNTSTGPTAGVSVNVIAGSSMPTTLEGVLLQNNTSSGAAHNCELANVATMTSNGSNLSDDQSCSAFTQPNDLVNNSSTVLAALAANGGPTRTRALVAGSSAVDAATCDATVTTDQRGAPRPVTGCDIGAYELGAVVPVTTTTTQASTTTSAGVTTTTAPATTTTADPVTTTTEAPATTTTIEPTTTTTADVQLADQAPQQGTTSTTFVPSTTVYVYATYGSLPVTGAGETLRLALFGAALVLAGAAALLTSRHRAGERFAEGLHTTQDD